MTHADRAALHQRGAGPGWLLCSLAIALGLAGTARVRGQQQFDAVFNERGVPTYGTITEMTRVQISVDTPQAGKKLFPVNEIQKVTFKDEPRELRTAREGILKGQLENARSDLDKISLDGVPRREIRQDIEFFKAYCDGRLALVGGGDKKAAVLALRAFVENPENGQTFHYYPAIELLGDLAVALSSFDNGIKYYSMLGESPWPDLKMKAAILEGRALVANRQYAEAMARFDSVLAAGLDDARARDQKLLATIGRAECLAGLARPDEGIALATKVIDENDSKEKPVLFARAYNALGVCYLRAGKPEEALLAFLHVDLLFTQDPDAHAEALYHLTALWKALNHPERALQARSLLLDRYSGSPWTNKQEER